jgi:hypothetical protein
LKKQTIEALIDEEALLGKYLGLKEKNEQVE